MGRPTKRTYKQGEDFNPAGMVLTATYSDTSTKIIAYGDYVMFNNTSLPAGSPSILFLYEEGGVTKYCSTVVTVEEANTHKLISLEIVSPPNKTEYTHGDTFDPTGMVVRAYFADETEEIIEGYTLINNDPVLAGQRTVIVSYTSGGSTKIANVDITVTRLAGNVTYSSLEVVKQPDKLVYRAGDDFDPTGMVVRMKFNDGSYRDLDISEISFQNNTNLTEGRKTITINHIENDTLKYTTLAVTVLPADAIMLEELVVQKMPTKTEYMSGENFNTSGMIVIARYNNGSIKEVSSYNIINGTSLTAEQTYVTLSYTELNVTKTVDVSIAVDARPSVNLTSIYVDEYPGRLTYLLGETFDPSGMRIRAQYSNNDTREIKNYIIVDAEQTFDIVGSDARVIRYTEYDITKEVAIQVNVINPEYTLDDPLIAVYYNDGTLEFQRGETILDIGDHTAANATIYRDFEDANYTEVGQVPWHAKRNTIKNVVFRDTMQPINMSFWFTDCTGLNSVSGNGLRTSSLTAMTQTFRGCTGLTSIDLSKWEGVNGNTMSSVMKFNDTFYNCNSMEHFDVEDWDVTSVTTMTNMFYDCSSMTELDLSNWSTPNLTNMSAMFANCSSLVDIDLTSFDVDSVTNLDSLFSGDASLTVVDLFNWTTLPAVNVEYMFYNCLNLETIYASNNFVVSKSDNSFNGSYAYTFTNCNSLVGGYGTAYADTHDATSNYAHIDKRWATGYFTEKDAREVSALLTSIELVTNPDKMAYDMSESFDSTGMRVLARFSNGTSHIVGGYTITTDDPFTSAGNHDVTITYTSDTGISKSLVFQVNVSGAYALFYSDGCLEFQRGDTPDTKGGNRILQGTYTGFEEALYTSVEAVPWHGNRPHIKTVIFKDHVAPRSIAYWFTDCTVLETVTGTGLNLMNVTNMNYAFKGCRSMVELDTSSWDTSKVKTMDYVFADCYMIQNITLDAWDTNILTSASYAFSNCKNLLYAHVDDWRTARLVNINYMLAGCNALGNVNLNSWNVNNILYMNGLFQNCNTLTEIDLSNWKTNPAVEIDVMFDGCASLHKIYASDNFVINKVLNSYNGSFGNTFRGCYNLVGGYGTAYANILDNSSNRAHIDKRWATGYFSEIVDPSVEAVLERIEILTPPDK